MEHSPPAPPGQAPDPRPIDDDQLRALLDGRRDRTIGHGPYILGGCDAWEDGWYIVRRYLTLGEARAAYVEHKPHLNTCGFYVAQGAAAQRKHEGCSWWCLPPWQERGERRPRAWGGRYDPERRAAYFAKLYDAEPDVDRARAAILKRCRECPDCAREAGAGHIKKLERQAAKERVSPSALLHLPMDTLK